MPWCPICKNEYKEGYTECSDCKATLLDELPKPIMFGPKEEMNQMKDVLAQLGYTTSYVSYDEKDRVYELAVPVDVAEEALMAMKAFVEEQQRVLMMEEFGVTEDVLEDSIALTDAVAESQTKKAREELEDAVYVDKSIKAEDHKSSAVTLVLVGGIGILLLVLHALGVIPVQLPNTTRIMLYVVMGSLFIIFIFSSIFSWKSYKRLLKEDQVEKEFLKKAKEEMKEITIEMIDAKSDLGETPDEMKYYKRIAVLKRIVEEKYPDASMDLINYLCEEYYNENYGTEYDTKKADAFFGNEQEEEIDPLEAYEMGLEED